MTKSKDVAMLSMMKNIDVVASGQFDDADPTMSDLAPRKQEHDYTKEADELLSSIDADTSLTASAKVDKLLVLEKQARGAADLSSTSRVLIKIITVLHDEAQDWDNVNVQLNALSRKHGQLREAVRRMVDKAMEWLPELENDAEKRLKLIETLRDVTEGKVRLIQMGILALCGACETSC